MIILGNIGYRSGLSIWLMYLITGMNYFQTAEEHSQAANRTVELHLCFQSRKCQSHSQKDHTETLWHSYPKETIGKDSYYIVLVRATPLSHEKINTQISTHILCYCVKVLQEQVGCLPTTIETQCLVVDLLSQSALAVKPTSSLSSGNDHVVWAHVGENVFFFKWQTVNSLVATLRYGLVMHFKFTAYWIIQ